MTKDFLDNLQLLALEQQQGGAGVSQIVEAQVRQPGALQDAREVSIDVPGLQRGADAARENEIMLVPKHVG
jgi:hypothetical protein